MNEMRQVCDRDKEREREQVAMKEGRHRVREVQGYSLRSQRACFTCCRDPATCASNCVELKLSPQNVASEGDSCGREGVVICPSGVVHRARNYSRARVSKQDRRVSPTNHRSLGPSP